VKVQLLVWIFVMRVMMLVASALSYFVNEAVAKARYGNSDDMNFETPLTSLVWVTSIISIILTFVVSKLIIPDLGGDPSLWWKLAMIISCGTLAGAIIPELVKVFTLMSSRHVQEIVTSSEEGGPSLNILSGLVAGNFSAYWLGASIVAITGNVQSALARGADLALDIGPIDEACPMGLVPTASSAALHAVGDALAMTLLKYRRFTSEEYALIHPGGKLGRSLMRVFEVMRSGDANPLVRDTATLSDAVVVMTNTSGRPGAACVVDKHGKLVGIFTDGDLRRMVERGQTNFEVEVKSVMCRQPRCVQPDELALTAAARMREAKVDQLPVVDGAGRAVGLLDIQDLLAARFF